jgi:hypothetical protein
VRQWFKPPLTTDGKWRITLDELFAMPTLPHRVMMSDYSLDDDDDPTTCDNHVWLTSLGNSADDEDRAPRLSEPIYKVNDRGQWWIVWCERASWEKHYCRALKYRPILRIKAAVKTR